MDHQEMKEMLITWMNRMKYGYRDSSMYMKDYQAKGGVKGFKLVMYTDNNAYYISALLESVDDKGVKRKSYLGCVSSCRKPRAGEDWTRGNDLSDGEFCEDTWNRIVYDIVGNELVKIHRPKEAQEVMKISKVNEQK